MPRSASARPFSRPRHRPRGLAGPRPITIIVPYTPGAPPDVIARLIADRLTRRLGCPVIVENRPGAPGNTGPEAVARAAPDGNTLLAQATTLAMNVSLFRSVPYDPIASFAPVATLMETEGALVLNAAAGGTDLGDFPARVRARPGAPNHASPGVGTSHHRQRSRSSGTREWAWRTSRIADRSAR